MNTKTPETGQTWIHANGIPYKVLFVCNDGINPNYPPAVAYEGENGKIWVRPLSDWHRSFYISQPIRQSTKLIMKTTELNGTEYKLTEGEGGKITLTPIIKQPEKRTPEAGDVWEDSEGFVEFITENGKGVDLMSGYISSKKYSQYPTHSSDTCLGKHHEVYVNRAEFISDIREALSHKDRGGDSVLNRIDGDLNINIGRSGTLATGAALRKLNIITELKS